MQRINKNLKVRKYKIKISKYALKIVLKQSCYFFRNRSLENISIFASRKKENGKKDLPKNVAHFATGYSKPRLECPRDVVAELPPGRDEAFVTFDQPATDLDWFRYVRSKPSWGTRLEATLQPGVHEITFFARHPISKKQASCVLRIIVKGN